MTNNLTSLSNFFADRDIDSLRVLGLEQHGVDIAGVYCLHTGRQVGTFDDFVIQFACDEESTDDDEALIDALVTRVVASMRPSPMLNKPDRITLLNLAERFPVDILSFLVNRLHGNRYLATHRPTDDALAPYFARIKTHQLWTALAHKGVNPRPWIHWLLELDAKRNLHDLTPPVVERDRLGKWTVSRTGESLFHIIDETNQAALLELFEKWTMERVKEFDARDKQAEAQAKWFRGNTMTQPAYARSWLENPQFASKRAELANKAKGKKESTARPKSEKASKLDAKVSQFLHLLDDIIEGGQQLATPPKAGPVIRTGASLSFKRKESV
jgi:hypothetical protein